MSKITDAFKDTKAFIPFITAGDPCLSKTVEYVVQMAKAGADIIEIGIPFSDPTAEGVVIQNANIRALANGFTMEGLFDAVKQIRSQTDIPLIFMTYINPVFHYGYEAFFAKCQELSVNGFISPDVPFEEKEEVEEVAKKYGVDVISMISPTSEERIARIAKEATGFIYVVSSMGVTGDPFCDGCTVCDRLRDQYTGAGREDGCTCRRCDRRQRDRQDRGRIQRRGCAASV